MKLRVGDGNEILNLGDIATSKLKDNAGRNGETLNIKLRVKNSDGKSNLGESAANKLAYYYISNLLVDTSAYGTVIPDHLVVSLIV